MPLRWVVRPLQRGDNGFLVSEVKRFGSCRVLNLWSDGFLFLKRHLLVVASVPVWRLCGRTKPRCRGCLGLRQHTVSMET